MFLVLDMNLIGFTNLSKEKIMCQAERETLSRKGRMERIKQKQLKKSVVFHILWVRRQRKDLSISVPQRKAFYIMKTEA